MTLVGQPRAERVQQSLALGPGSGASAATSPVKLSAGCSPVKLSAGCSLVEPGTMRAPASASTDSCLGIGQRASSAARATASGSCPAGSSSSAASRRQTSSVTRAGRVPCSSTSRKARIACSIPSRMPIPSGAAKTSPYTVLCARTAATIPATSVSSSSRTTAIVSGGRRSPQLLSSGRFSLSGDPFLALRFASLFRLQVA